MVCSLQSGVLQGMKVKRLVSPLRCLATARDQLRPNIFVERSDLHHHPQSQAWGSRQSTLLLMVISLGFDCSTLQPQLK